jgi:HPt (histidine-containing phosphotransfer) domain-containing protein
MPNISELSGPHDGAAFAETVFRDFQKLMSRDETAEWLRKLSGLLQSTFCGRSQDAVARSELVRRAHAIVSLAGFLGFAELARRCGAIEEACHAEADLAPSFEAASAAARAALRTLDALR